MTGGASDEIHTPSTLPAWLGVITSVAVGIAMTTSEAPWTLALDAGFSFIGQTVPAFRSWVGGSGPEWSDLVWGGFPLIAEPTTAALYLPHLLTYLATLHAPLRFFDAALALHLGLLAAGSATLLRELGATAASMVLAAVLIVLIPSGHFHAVTNVASLEALAWLPWVLTAAERLARPATARMEGAMLLGCFALAAQVLVGMPEHALYSGVVAGVWIVLRRSGLGLLERAFRLLLLSTSALALSAPQTLATLAYLPFTTRAGSAPAAQIGSLWIHEPLGLLVPGLMSGACAFFGLATLALAGVALLARRGGASLLLGVALVAFLLSLGPQVGLYEWFHRIPPFGYFRAPVKIYPYAEMSLVWAAALGADVLLRSAATGRRRIAAALCGLAVVEHLVFAAYDDRAVLNAVRGKAPPSDVVELLADVPALRPSLPSMPPPLVLDMSPPLGGGYAGSLGALLGVASLHPGGVSLLPRAHAHILYQGISFPLANLLGVRFALVPTDECPSLEARWRWRRVAQTRDFCVLENPARPRRFSVVDQAVAVDSMDAMIEAVQTRPQGPLPVLAPAEIVADLGPGRVVGQQVDPRHISLLASSPGRMLLLIRQSFVPGWSAMVDGAPAKIYPAAGLYFALPVSAGTHEIKLTYRAPGFRAGLAIGLTWTAAVGLWLVVGRRRDDDVQEPAREERPTAPRRRRRSRKRRTRRGVR